jgi:GAF domain-containing protein
MGRGATSARDRVEARSAVTRKSRKVDASTGLELKQRLAEALEQHAAVSEILQVMSASPSDVRPVLDAVAERASRLCQAPLARVLLVDGDVLRAMAEYSLDGTSQARTVPLPLKRTTLTGRAVLDRITVHHDDVVPLLDNEYPDALNARRLGLRAVLAVPLMREGNAYGAVLLWRREPGLFSPEHVALVQTFAQQAAIAIDNVRLFKETKEGLERQTATSEILRVISHSPTDVQPVFDTIAAAALKLCNARSAVVLTFDGELLQLAAFANVDPAGADALRLRYPMAPGRGNAASRAILTRSVVAIPDVLEDPEFEINVPLLSAGFRSIVSVPLMREGSPIGAITVARAEPGSFPEKQIALLQTFADQAVIAIENVRLFKDTAEAFEKQAAISEILQVISNSPGDVKPMLNAVAERAAKLCGAADATILLVEEEKLRSAARFGDTPGALEVGEFIPLTRGSVTGRAVVDRTVIHLEDLATASEEEFPVGRELQRQLGHHTALSVPLMREDRAIGAIALWRMEVRRFTDEQVALLKTFADQAAVAIENVRLFDEEKTRTRELAESLQQQTATADVLKVISRSAFDLHMVLETLTESACKLCEAETSTMWRPDGDVFKVAAMFGQSPRHEAAIKQRVVKPGRDTCVARTLLEGRTVHIHDAAADPEYNVPDFLSADGNRTLVGVPLVREGAPIGVLVLTRSVARPFTEKQIALATTFADQAVIAIENVRLFNETKEALEQQTATSEILRVISSSPTHLQPVLEAVVSAASRFCGAPNVMILRVDGAVLRGAAAVGQFAEVVKLRAGSIATVEMPISRASVAGRAVYDRRTLHVHDLATERENEYPIGRELQRQFGHRTILATPLLREGVPLGVICLFRMEVKPFSEKQMELLRTFADQAVIAIENVRLFTELEARTLQLMRSVGELRALGEVGQAVSSTLDLETVLSTIVSRATQLAGMDGGSIWEYDETNEEFHLHATDRLPDALVEVLRATPIRKGEGALGRLAVTGEPVEIRDIADESSYPSRVREAIIRCGYRSVLVVPLLREDRLLGALAVNRNSAGEFAPEVIELLKTFATQSALAIQNARLFREIEEKSRELETASRHKSEFLANMSHELRTPLNAIIGFSEVLSERMFGEINEKQAEYIGDILESGRHLLSLINDILDLSKIEAGRMELEPTEFELPSAIENALTLVKERAHRRGIALVRTVDERLGMIRADERKVKQVLLNLLSNALKFTPEGGQVDVRARVHDGETEISVTDTGVGIAPEDQGAVFEEFRQVGTASQRVEGTGLGLAISRKFIELHGGRIWVESQVGKGSRFAFTLPLTIDQLHRIG